MSGLDVPAELEELIGLSNRFGADPLFVRAGGGNSSAKVGEALWIKPSGVPLATLAADDLVPLDRARLLALLDADPASLPREADPVMAVAAQARLAEAHGRRPSVELLFHALLPERLVLHTHPIHVNAVTCSADGPALARRLFGDEAVWVPYTDPGLPLAHAIVTARRAHEARTASAAPPITLLGNHGLIVGGETAADIEARTAWLVGIIEGELASRPGVDWSAAGLPDEPLMAAVAGAFARGAVAFSVDAPILGWASSPRGRSFMAGGPLIPDQIVYTGSWPLVVDIDPEHAQSDAVASLVRQRVAEFTAQRGVSPIIVVVPGVGLFAAGDSERQAESARDIYLDMLRTAEGADRLGGVRHMSDAERTFIEHWEAEAYRKQVAAGR